MIRGQLIENPYGALSLWEHPIEGAEYAVGVDTSSGIRESVREGDPSAACVIEMRTCRQVAEMHGYLDPTLWGWACARLAWYFNTAWLAIESQPSQHGLTAYVAAERYPYPRLCRQKRIEPINGRLLERRGWVRPARSSETLFNRIRDAMREGCPIRSSRLLDELSAMRYEEGKFKSDEHDDCIVAYGIALMARDQLYSEGEVVVQKKRPTDLAESYWQRQADSRPDPSSHGDDYRDTWDGS